MPVAYTNWVYDKGTVMEKDRIALERAKRQELRNERKGYRWIKINDKNKLFVPCDKQGNPTTQGLVMINNFKAYMGIK